MHKELITSLFIFFMLPSALSSGRHRMNNYNKLRKQKQNVELCGGKSKIDPHCDCGIERYKIIQKIPYTQHISTCEPIDVDFSSACIKCTMCLGIAAEINQTLLDVHQAITTDKLNETEISFLLRTICEHSFKHYGIREIDGKRYLSDRFPGSQLIESSKYGIWGKNLKETCHKYLDEMGELKLYEKWLDWCFQDESNQNLSTVLCRNTVGMLRDCNSIESTELPLFLQAYHITAKITAKYFC